MMRNSVAALLVLAGMIAGYALRGVPVGAQAHGDSLPFAAGETVKLSLLDFNEGSTTCKVSQVVNGFVGCVAPDPNGRSERWINLRFVKDVTRRNP